MHQLSSILLLALSSGWAVALNQSEYASSPPVYPSPNITGTGGWDAALAKAKAFVNQLTLEEKAGMVTGTPGPCVGNIAPIPRLNFSGLCLQDGPLAIRQALLASVFPAGISAAASWDRDLIRQRGQYMAEEFREKGAHVLLGPVAGPMGRSPYSGRNWEGFSPDPYLTGVAIEESVSGIQAAGVQACTKHYILNEQETQRQTSVVNGTLIETLSSNLDDRTMHEQYLWPFANAVKAGTASVMCSYNRINGSQACQNSKSLNGLLKDELGFQGYVMSDWGGTYSGVPAIEAGLDMNMPGGIAFTTPTPSYWGENITTAVNNGSLAVERLDDMIHRVLTPWYALGQDSGYPVTDGTAVQLNFFGPASSWPHQFTLGPLVDVRDNHASLIRELGAAGTVLLKNTNNALPLKEPKNIAVFGSDAPDLTVGEYYATLSDGESSGATEIGTQPVGGGSGSGRFSYVVSPLEAIKAKAKEWGALVQYITSNYALTNGALSTIAPQPDVCLVFLKSWAAEGADRTTLLTDWNSTAVVNEVASTCNNTIVVVHNAGIVTLPWANNKNVTGILMAHQPGQETGNSLVDILWGDVNPSGKLPYTIAKNESDYSKNLLNSTALLESTDPNAWQAYFTEGLLTDYREFDAKNESVAYEFGYGLSYTTFNISNLQISNVGPKNASRVPSASAPIAPGGNQELWDTFVKVSATVSNTGAVDGAAVPQLYLSFPAGEAGSGTPVRVLRGFDKLDVEAGGSATVEFELLRRDVSYWDTVTQQWTLPKGSIGVAAGFSSRDLPLTGSLTV